MTSFTESIAILSHLKRLFGLNISPMDRFGSVNVSLKTNKHNILRMSKTFSLPWFFYALLLHTTHLTLFCKSISFNVNIKVSSLDFGLDMMFSIVAVNSMITTIIWSFKNTTKLSKLKISIQNFDYKFEMFGKSVSNRQTKLFVIYELVIVLLFWLFYFIYYVIWNCDTGTVKCFRNWFTLYHPHKIVLVAFMEELALIHGLNTRFRCLNKYLMEMEFDDGVKVKHRYFGVMNNGKINHCRELHYYLCDLTTGLNRMLSLQTAVNILDCFVNIFVMLYLACFGYSRDVENSTAAYNPLGILLPLTVGAEAFAKIFYLSKYYSMVQAESKRTGEILHKISIYTVNENIKNEILHFSQQILHKNVHITACGMFPIDYSLIYNIVAAVTTFIVILIQFAMAIKYSPPTVTAATMINPTENYGLSTSI